MNGSCSCVSAAHVQRLHVSASAEIACDEQWGRDRHCTWLVLLLSILHTPSSHVNYTSNVDGKPLTMTISGAAYLTAACASISLTRP